MNKYHIQQVIERAPHWEKLKYLYKDLEKIEAIDHYLFFCSHWIEDEITEYILLEEDETGTLSVISRHYNNLKK